MIENAPRARYIMVGGFLGAGKTTAIGQLARFVSDHGLRVGLISNDQSSGLVDTAVFRSQGFPVAEIAGGCFCCRFHSLLEANQLTEQTKPDIIIGEPVGSCTDLVATVSYPLRRIYGDRYTTAALSVLVDPLRCARILGLEPGRSFSPKVSYVYRKQLQEAGMIIVNKCDLLTDVQRDALVAALRREFAQAEILCGSALRGDGLDDWFERLLHDDANESPTMELDYKRYAEGEALLGWLNCTVDVDADTAFSADDLLLELMRSIAQRLQSGGDEIAHLKMTLESPDALTGLSAVSLVQSDAQPHLRESLPDSVRSGQLIINLRAEADPDGLREAVEESLHACATSRGDVRLRVEHMENFRPGEPNPTHRVTVDA